MLEVLSAVVGAAIVCATAGMIGLPASLLFSSDELPLGTTVLLGLGIQSGVGAVFALFGVLTPIGVFTISVCCFIIGFLRHRLRFFLLLKEKAARATLADGFFALVWVIVLPFATAPPVFYDAMIYELSVPQDWLLGEPMAFMPQSVHGNMPGGWFVLVAFAMAWGGDSAPQVLSYLLWVITAAEVVKLLPAGASRHTRWVTFCLAWGAPLGVFFSTLAKADIYFTACLMAALRMVVNSERQNASLGGAFLGLALGSKYLGVPAAALVLAIGVLTTPSGKKTRSFLVAACVCLLIGGPWYVRNLWWTGDPFYPALHAYLEDPGWSARQAAILSAEARHVAWRDLSWTSIVRALSTISHGPLRWGTGLLSLFALAAIAFRSIRNSRERILGVFSLAYLALWIGSFQLPRFALACVLPLWPSLALLMSNNRWQKLATATAVVSVLFAGFEAMRVHQSVFHTGDLVRGIDSRESFREREVSCYALKTKLSQAWRNEGRVLFVGEGRRFYARFPNYAPAAMNQNPIFEGIKNGLSFEELSEQLSSNGFHTLLYNPSETARLERTFKSFDLSEAQRTMFRKFVAEHFELATEEGRCQVFVSS